ncbi:MAG: hypothetical protein WBB00_20390 [Mycobacterium sp.]
MHEPFIGSEALAARSLTRGALRWNYTALYPDVYIHKDARIDIHDRARAAWLWTGRKGVIAGTTAAALYGVGSIDTNATIELIAPPRRARPGVVVRTERIGSDEVEAGPLPCTTPARTALDLARRLPRDEAVVLLDQLSECTDVSAADVAPLEARYRSARGTGSAWEAIRLMDGGSRSPEETRLRLMLIDGGLPRPRTSIFVEDDSYNFATMDDQPWGVAIGMGWVDAKVGVEWAAHRRALRADIDFKKLLQQKGWLLIEVTHLDTRGSTIRRCKDALRQRWGRLAAPNM